MVYIDTCKMTLWHWHASSYSVNSWFSLLLHQVSLAIYRECLNHGLIKKSLQENTQNIYKKKTNMNNWCICNYTTVVCFLFYLYFCNSQIGCTKKVHLFGCPERSKLSFVYIQDPRELFFGIILNGISLIVN